MFRSQDVSEVTDLRPPRLEISESQGGNFKSSKLDGSRQESSKIIRKSLSNHSYRGRDLEGHQQEPISTDIPTRTISIPDPVHSVFIPNKRHLLLLEVCPEIVLVGKQFSVEFVLFRRKMEECVVSSRSSSGLKAGHPKC